MKLGKPTQNEQTRRFFDAAARGWTARYDRDATVAARKTHFLTAVQATLDPPADILDFGCGSGDITLHLSQAGYRLTGFDLSEAMLAEARRRDAEGRIQWIAQPETESGAKFPFQNSAFDAAITSSVLEYVPDVDATLAQLARVLRSGGWLYATVPDMRDQIRKRESWLRLAATFPFFSALLGRSPWREGAAYLRISTNRMHPNAWLKHLRRAGFSPKGMPETNGPLLLLTARKE